MKNLQIINNCGRLGAGGQREEWIEEIMNNSQFDEDELQEMDNERLEYLARKLGPIDEDEAEEIAAMTAHLDNDFKPGNKAKTTQEEDEDEAEEIAAMTSFLDEPKKTKKDEEGVW